MSVSSKKRLSLKCHKPLNRNGFEQKAARINLNHYSFSGRQIDGLLCVVGKTILKKLLDKISRFAKDALYYAIPRKAQTE